MVHPDSFWANHLFKVKVWGVLATLPHNGGWRSESIQYLMQLRKYIWFFWKYFVSEVFVDYFMHGKHISKTFWADIYGVHTVPMVPKHVCMLHWLRCCNFHYTWCGILLKGFLYKFFVSFEMRQLNHKS